MTLSNATSGGTWSSSVTAKATVGLTSGIVTGVAAGTTNITYRVSTGCISITQVTVNAALAAITGTTSVCVAQTITLSHATSGGTWSSSNTAKAVVDTAGVVTGVSAGVVYITYTLTSGCYKTMAITVKALPLAITGPASVLVGAFITLADASSGGAWSSSSTPVATVAPSTGVVNGISAGSVTITYNITSTGCYVTYPIDVVPGGGRPGFFTNEEPVSFSVHPNPTSGSLVINADVNGQFTVYMIDGKLVQQYDITTRVTNISLPANLVAGVYMCRFTGTDGSTKMVRLVFEFYR